MPNPNPGEKKSDYIGRCIDVVMTNGEAESQDQAIAICESKWINASAYRKACKDYGITPDEKQE